MHHGFLNENLDRHYLYILLIYPNLALNVGREVRTHPVTS